MMRATKQPGGVALLTALILLAVTSAIAFAMSFDTGLAIRRSAGAVATEQAAQLAAAAEALAAELLAEQLEDSTATVHGGQNWASQFGPVEIVPGAILEARLQDLQGRFNINALVSADGSPAPRARETFIALLTSIEVEADLADQIIDWLDPNTIAVTGGAEDARYSGLVPGYRTPNRSLTSTSELLQLPQMDLPRYRRLEPHITALPRDAGLNVCTASGALLDALAGETQWGEALEALQRNRGDGCFPRLDALRNAARSPDEFAALASELALGETSRYFALESRITVGTSTHTLYSLLRHDGQARQVRVILRQTAP